MTDNPAPRPSIAPSLPEEVLNAIAVYGDARADVSDGSPMMLAAAILAIRRWAAELVAQRRLEAALTPLDYSQLVATAWTRHRWAAGTAGCIAFARGAEWAFATAVARVTPPDLGKTAAMALQLAVCDPDCVPMALEAVRTDLHARRSKPAAGDAS